MEFHSNKNGKVRDVIKSSMGMRKSPHLCTITTAGFDKSVPCYELRQTCVEVLKGLKTDDSMFAMIFSLDPEDDWTDPKVWYKANPNLNVTVFESYLKEQITAAQNNLSEQVGVKTKNLNVWCDTSSVWVPDVVLVNSERAVDWSEFQGKQVYVGVDLAAVSDMTAVAYMVEDNDRFIFKVEYFLPEAQLNKGSNASYYKKWRDEGYLNVTSGNVTDYDAVTLNITSKQLMINNISYDQWNATQWAIDCTAKGLPLNPYSQTIGNFNRPTKEFERLINGKRVVIDNSPVTNFCFKNVVIKTDSNGNQKPNKSESKQKIDGVIAMLMAFGGYLQQPHYSNTIFTV